MNRFFPHQVDGVLSNKQQQQQVHYFAIFTASIYSLLVWIGAAPRGNHKRPASPNAATSKKPAKKLKGDSFPYLDSVDRSVAVPKTLPKADGMSSLLNVTAFTYKI
jgi:hypothetical protein